MKIKIARIEKDFPVNELGNEAWQKAEEAVADQYWSGESAPEGRHFKAKLLWSDKALYVRFEANQSEPLVIGEERNPSSKTRGLWNLDVCEIFLAPDRDEPGEYFEFEVAPNGNWIDLKISQENGERVTDWDYYSGMQTTAFISSGKVWAGMKIVWNAFGVVPKAGDIWLGNLLRCVGKGETRGYLAWSPTGTKEPNFHVPERFGEFEFSE